MTNTTNKRKIIFSLIHTIVLMTVVYLIWNEPGDFNDGGSFLQKVHVLKKAKGATDTIPSDLLLINTCYDHVMVPAVVPAVDEEDVLGVIDITNREKLLTLFQTLNRYQNYRYIVCDIIFDEKYKTSADSALFGLLGQMKRCVVPKPTYKEVLPDELEGISAVSAYEKTIVNNNFLKYQYLTPDGASIALKMAQDMDDINIKKWGPFYTLDGHLCINSHIPDISTNVTSIYRQTGEHSADLNVYQLGQDILPDIDDEGLYAGKIIMIGDFFEKDTHETVAGKIPGIIIIYNAYKDLAEKRNVPAFLMWLSMFIVFFAVTLLITRGKSLHDLIRNRCKRINKSPLLSLVVDWLGFELLFIILGVATYLFYGLYVDAWIGASYFIVFEKTYPVARLVLKKYIHIK